MNREMIEMYLERYRANIGRCGYLKVRIRRMEEEIEATKAEEVNPLRSGVWDGLPRGTGISDVTGLRAVRIADGEWPERIREMERELRKMERERAKVRAAIDCVDEWLAALPEREAWIVRTKVIDGITWETVKHLYLKRYGSEYSLSGLKHIRADAVRRICEMAA